MTVKKVLLSNYNSKNYKNIVLKKSLSYLRNNKGDSFLYIVPNGRILNRYREYFIENCPNISTLNLITFQDIGYKLEIFQDKLTINESLKLIIIENIFRQGLEKGEIIYYKEMIEHQGFIKNISYIISKLKSSLVEIDAYIKECEENLYLKEIAYVYKEYEDYLLKENLYDLEDKYTLIIEGIRDNFNSPIFKDLDFIIIDEFDSFRRQEYEIIKELSSLNTEIYINIPSDRPDRFKSLEETIGNLEKLNFIIEEDNQINQVGFLNLANIVFTDKKLDKDLNNIKFIKAPSKEIELEKVSEIIKGKHKLGYKLNEMALVAPNIEKYGKIINKVFERESLPHNLKKELKLISHPLVRELLNIYKYNKFKDRSFLTDRLANRYMSSVFYKNTNKLEDITDFKNIDFNKLKKLENPEYKELIEDIYISLEQEEKILKECKTLGQYLESSLKFIELYKVKDNIYNIYKNIKDYDILHRDLKVLGYIVKDIENILGMKANLTKEINLVEYVEILEHYGRNTSVTIYEGNNKGVSILSSETARALEYKIVFIVGLTQGEYPNLSNNNFFLRDENAKFFKKINLDYKTYEERLDKESLNFTRMLALANNELYLSYSENLEEVSLPSMFWEELVFKLKESNQDLDMISLDLNYPMVEYKTQVTTEDKLFRHVLYNSSEGEFKIDATFDHRRFNFIKLRSNSELQRSLGANEYNGCFKNPEILKDLANLMDGKLFSSSFLEDYGKCPYSFYLKRVLGLEKVDQEERELDSLEKGRIHHNILEKFYKNNLEKILSHIYGEKELDESYIKEFVYKNYKDNISNMGLDEDNHILNLKVQVNSNILTDFIIGDLKRLSFYGGKICPSEFERDFGSKGDFNIEIGGKNYPFIGYIDRIDKYKEDKYILVDYKSSSYRLASKSEIERGISFQMPIYLLYLGLDKVVGAMYNIISTGNLEPAIFKKEYSTFFEGKRKGIYNREEINELLEISKSYIESYLGSIYKGYFPVEPKECSDFCDFKEICRFSEER